MEVDVDRKYRKLCSIAKEARKKFGPENARKLNQRIRDLQASDNLHQFIQIGIGRPHQLKGNRHEQFAIDLKHPCRLVIAIGNDPIPRRSDGGLELKAVTSVRIVLIGDYHD